MPQAKEFRDGLNHGVSRMMACRYVARGVRTDFRTLTLPLARAAVHGGWRSVEETPWLTHDLIQQFFDSTGCDVYELVSLAREAQPMLAVPDPPEPPLATVDPEPPLAAVHPEPPQAAVHPEPPLAAVHPEPPQAAVHPEPPQPELLPYTKNAASRAADIYMQGNGERLRLARAKSGWQKNRGGLGQIEAYVQGKGLG